MKKGLLFFVLFLLFAAQAYAATETGMPYEASVRTWGESLLFVAWWATFIAFVLGALNLMRGIHGGGLIILLSVIIGGGIAIKAATVMQIMGFAAAVS